MKRAYRSMTVYFGAEFELVAEFVNLRAEEITQAVRRSSGNRRFREKPTLVMKQIMVEAAEGFFERTGRPRPVRASPTPPAARPTTSARPAPHPRPTPETRSA